ncbi:hypothetical protein RJ640_024162 [Escallonia rubra]|uniref:DUF4378 domain-containing protein n=1 Tax=Escallonia rubra TaxID=112253 RepID=A0AA88R045_9ASTE|nr:hypothetical protein RJ640_024162 [Escallonia rubra]
MCRFTTSSVFTGLSNCTISSFTASSHNPQIHLQLNRSPMLSMYAAVHSSVNPHQSHFTWLSPDRPLAPWVFDNLEKKYCDETTGLRSERRLMFDRINSALLDNFQRLLGSYVQASHISRTQRRRSASIAISMPLSPLLR